ncbi:MULTISPECIES: DUF4352 domain-containing protein [unclassified Streptomyces]|uniref:DUF4352 domain-containing protein n=1 Tax=Streptomyces machairae TaxID=3134109 RepID=A0ABU8UP02_9ACTN|nr:DUF4352 domain-containing protein [Streptomyces sp. NBC_01017]
MRTRTTIAVCLLLAGLTASCSSNDTDEPTVAKASVTESAGPTPSPTPSPRQETYKLGDIVDISAGGNDFSAATLTYKNQGVTSPPGLLQEGQKFATVQVKVCNRSDEPIEVSPFTWSLAYEDGARVEPTHVSGGGLPQPAYPLDAKVRGGDCVRGYILFEVPEEFGRAERVLYSPGDLDEPVEWTVPTV